MSLITPGRALFGDLPIDVLLAARTRWKRANDVEEPTPRWCLRGVNGPHDHLDFAGDLVQGFVEIDPARAAQPSAHHDGSMHGRSCVAGATGPGQERRNTAKAGAEASRADKVPQPGIDLRSTDSSRLGSSMAQAVDGRDKDELAGGHPLTRAGASRGGRRSGRAAARGPPRGAGAPSSAPRGCGLGVRTRVAGGWAGRT